MRTLDVLIFTHNARSFIDACLRSMLEHRPTGLTSAVYVIGNASTDGTADDVNTRYPEVTVVARRTNGGCAVANNDVLRTSSADFVLLLNPDTELSRGALDTLIARLDDDATIGLLGCRLVRKHGSFDHASKRSLRLGPRDRSYAFSHDWQHLRRPHQFSRAQHLYRRSWRTSVLRSRIVFAISDNTAQEVLTVAPSARVVVAPNGSDHPRRWAPPPAASEGTCRLVTFGHKNHKRPERAIRALPMVRRDVPSAELIVLGAEGSYRAQPAPLADDLGVADRCSFPGFVSVAEYQDYVSTAAAVLLLSDDDGFGLPLAEADHLGAVGIVAADGRLGDLHGSVLVAAPIPDSVAAAVLSGLQNRSSASRETKTGRWTWGQTVGRVRGEIESDQASRLVPAVYGRGFARVE
jgi:glycosyltransferase involved in cell wall biosynthesis